ncbi:MAG: CobW family GTP-binding protein [Halanaerobiales bacterium]
MSVNRDKIKKFFITGFLGAGKTTLLNNMLKSMHQLKLGIIVNEFGEINVDKEVIEIDENTRLEEINNGSIFCSCLSGSFIKSILSYEKLPVDYLLVESSGLSQPTSLKSILETINKQTDVFDYRGMIGVVDAARFLTLVQSVKAVREQVIYSDFIVVNKIDQVDKETLNKVIEKIREFNQDAEIFQTSFGKIGDEIITRDMVRKIERKEDLAAVGCNVSIDNFSLRIKDSEKVKRPQLEKIVENIAGDIYRIKGFISTDNGGLRVDGVNSDISITKVEKIKGVEGLIIFSEDKAVVENKLKEMESELELEFELK